MLANYAPILIFLVIAGGLGLVLLFIGLALGKGQKDPDKTDGIAVRFVFTGTLTTPDVEREFEVEGASFIKVVDHMLSEWRVVVDTAFLDDLRSAMGRPLP